MRNKEGGIGFIGLLLLVFITLKLCNVIHWSWWLVLLPAYIPIAAILVVLFCLLLAHVINTMQIFRSYKKFKGEK